MLFFKKKVHKKPLLQRLSHFFFLSGVFLLPFHIDTFLYKSSLTLEHGIAHHFASSFFGLSELLLLLGIGIHILRTLHEKHKNSHEVPQIVVYSLLLVSVALLLTSFFAIDLPLHILQSRLWLEGFLVLWYVISHSKIVTLLSMPLFVIGVIQSLVAILQFILNHSLGLVFLGESTFSIDNLSTAKFSLGSVDHIRAYGTFQHPNILGIFLLFVLLFAFLHSKHLLSYVKRPLYIVGIGVIALGIFVSLSKTALFLFVVFCLLQLLWNIGKKYTFQSAFFYVPLFFLVPFVLALLILGLYSTIGTIFNITTITDRTLLLVSSFQVFTAHLFGVGLQNFTLALPELSYYFLPWQYQPVHNIFALTFTELGIIGGMGFLLLFIAFWRKSLSLLKRKISIIPFFFVILFTIHGLVDHALVTTPALFFMFWIALGYLLQIPEEN